MRHISLLEATDLARTCAKQLLEKVGHRMTLVGIPRGGIPAALLLRWELTFLSDGAALTEVLSSTAHPEVASFPVVVVDDIYVTGKTLSAVCQRFSAPYATVLVWKGERRGEPRAVIAGETASFDEWVEFPWETADPDLGKPESAVRRLIEFAGLSPYNEIAVKKFIEFLEVLHA